MVDLAPTPTPRLGAPGALAPPAATAEGFLEARPAEAIRTNAGREDVVMRRIVGFSAASLGFIVLVVLIVWVMGGLEGGDLGVHGWVALVSGSVLTSVLGVALMALGFYSDRSGHDEAAGGSGRA